ncbi:tetratricopeptide repeat protein [Streptomyces resistomycificus]|uniref:Tetratricopeptide repeat protein n=1 Tax=Streptomyces resistomycificus TaxID=67356 RepID=A0A0L8LVB7_9ACTN|nr:tetratricopeptide repeat protein [Streptomyces resistomycificus]KOG42096.1 hypothetical protein ADK37_06150 [Streptomyces resistomycificus]KUN91276.1 hypothetical protein AQJ84_37465 [Streptomyces resistomycificus]
MARLSRDKKRDQQRGAHPAVPAAAPIDIHVPASGPGAGAAWAGGVRIAPAPGEEVQQAVLTHLHDLARAGGHPVVATVHDERIGYVVPLEVAPDGASRFTADPVPMAPQAEQAPAAGASPPPVGEPVRPAPSDRPAPSAFPDAPADTAEPQQPPRDLPTHLLRPVDEQPVRDAIPTFRMRTVPEPAPTGETTPTSAQPADETPRTFTLRALPDPAPGHAPGTVAPPTGAFGPPPVMDAPPERVQPTPPAAPGRPAAPERPAAAERPVSPLLPDRSLLAEPEPEPKPTPPRGFDAVAEAVLGDDPLTVVSGAGDAPPLLAEPLARINEAVKAGRTDTASELADRTLSQASTALGPEHPEVLHLRELAAYIAYLAGDPDRAFRLSLDLAHARHRMRDEEAAYGNVQSAFTAWRAVRDPLLGLELGQALIGLWSEMAAEEGPAADDIEQLDKARARMGRLTERAQNAR